MQTQPHCPRCGRQLSDQARFCPFCGVGIGSPQAPGTGQLAPRSILKGRYLIERMLARGGQSAVYLAHDQGERNLERAIKEMSEGNLSRAEYEKALNNFMREANMLAQLQHPALARVYDVFVEDGKHYLVMEYVTGHSLEDELMAAQHGLEWQRVGQWGILLCEVFAYLHAHQPPIIYRDLKPPNVMLTSEGQVKLIDFGIARWLHPMRQQDTMQLGTDGYAPPEQYIGRSEPRSDLYALGATMYHLLTGRVPESSPLRESGRTLAPIRAFSEVPDAFERAIFQAMNLQAQDRFRDALMMRDALGAAMRAGGRVNGGVRITPRPLGTLGAVGAMGAATSGGRLPTAAPRHVAGASPARLHVTPLRLDAGIIEPDQCAVLQLDVSNRGGGQLTGQIETNLPCLSVDPETVHATTTTLFVRINTLKLPPGPYTCHVLVRTNGGDTIIPVRFIVRAQPEANPLAR